MGLLTNRELFLRHVAQTSPAPLALEIVKARGSRIWDASGKEYIDLIGGISVCNTGHCHPEVTKAVRDQTEKYMHLMVYGELIQSPQVEFARTLAEHLPPSLQSVYFTNSGSEATEGAMKLAKRVTGRSEVVAFRNSYHGSTQGALSIMGDEYWRNAYRPLLPGIWHEDYGGMDALKRITTHTAMVMVEPVQAEMGVNAPSVEWIRALRRKCDETGTLLVMDEIQTGFGRTGTLWAFEKTGVVPDILLLGKALGGGMPLGAFVASPELMRQLSHDPVLGHITTFGGHPVSCAAGLASFKVLFKENVLPAVASKSARFISLLRHEKIKSIRAAGLLMAIEFSSFEENKRIIDACIENGLFTDWFLFAPHCMRIAPPLIISDDEIQKAAEIIKQVLDA